MLLLLVWTLIPLTFNEIILHFTHFEMKAALKKVKDNKAAGIDKLPGELLKVNPERSTSRMDTRSDHLST